MHESEHTAGHTTGSDERTARELHSPVQVIHLPDLIAQVTAERERHNSDHTAYTLRNAAALRQVLLSFRADGHMADHQAAGGVAIQVLDGEVAVTVAAAEYVLGPGDLLDLAPALRHSLHARRASSVLLTIAAVAAPAEPAPAAAGRSHPAEEQP